MAAKLLRLSQAASGARFDDSDDKEFQEEFIYVSCILQKINQAGHDGQCGILVELQNILDVAEFQPVQMDPWEIDQLSIYELDDSDLINIQFTMFRMLLPSLQHHDSPLTIVRQWISETHQCTR